MATWLTIEEAAKHLKIGKSTLYQMARDGKVPAQKLGRAWRFDVEDLDKWMKCGSSPKISSFEDLEHKRGSAS
jgi:excisionase family DNA binding protein